jgi:hypothetical protein
VVSVALETEASFEPSNISILASGNGALVWKVESGAVVDKDQVIAEIVGSTSSVLEYDTEVGDWSDRLALADREVMNRQNQYYLQMNSVNWNLWQTALSDRQRLLDEFNQKAQLVSVKQKSSVKSPANGILTMSIMNGEVTLKSVIASLTDPQSWQTKVALSDPETTDLTDCAVRVISGQQSWEGKISSYDNQTLVLAMNDSLPANLTGELEVIGQIKDNVVVVSRSDAWYQNGQWWVRKVGQSVPSNITVGLIGSDTLEVIDGVSEGDALKRGR